MGGGEGLPSCPLAWFTVYIALIPKPGKDPTSCYHHLPVSLTCNTCKLMERLVASRLVPTLEQLHAFSDYQFGFRRHRSTQDPLLRLDHDIRESFASNKMTLTVLFDLEKAYDSTWRLGVLRSLHSLGLRGQLPLFLQLLMSDRSFQVRCGATLSRCFVLDEGVPQGSLLSVLLFAIGFNGVIDSIPTSVRCSIYVDDLALYISGAKLPCMERQLQVAIDRVSSWCSARGFTFSTSKTTAVLFRKNPRRRGRLQSPPMLRLYGSLIHVVPRVRFLGLLLDERLTYLPHIPLLKANCRRSLCRKRSKER